MPIATTFDALVKHPDGVQQRIEIQADSASDAERMVRQEHPYVTIIRLVPAH